MPATMPLSRATLTELDPRIIRPSYLDEKVGNGILHLGVGNFHRAHQAVYTDTMLNAGDHRWGIVGVNLHSHALRDRLVAQDFLYSVLALSADSSDVNAGDTGPSADTNELRIIGSLNDVLALPQCGTQAIIEHIANPATQVITLTITEKGYCLANGELDASHPDVVHDLAHTDPPRTALGLLALGLAARSARKAGPITLLSCDNLLGNGQVLAKVLNAFVAASQPALSSWLTDHVRCCSSMVDRIVPATEASATQQFNLQDEARVICEPFSQWVIEEQFAGLRPPWELAGAQWVSDVGPFEQAKLRLLNASHSALAYLGLLTNHEYIHQALAVPAIRSFIDQLFKAELVPLVQAPQGMDLTQYVTTIISRFSNSAVPYTTAQVATDGAQKLPQRILPSLRQAYQQDHPRQGLLLVLAAWLQCLNGKSDGGGPVSVNDPLAQDLRDYLATHTPSPDGLIQFALNETPHFSLLAHYSAFAAELTTALHTLRKRGTYAAIAAV
ncbi:MAG: mannitol dehydrogenase family protein [Pseudomonadales bacterium]